LSDQREIIVELFGAAMKYGSGPAVLRDIDLILQAGSFHVLLGANAAGKTSMLRLIATLADPSAGRMTLFGQDPAAIGHAERLALRRRIGVVFQDLRLLDHLTVHDNVALPLRIAGVPPAEAGPSVDELLEWLGIGAVQAKRPPELAMAERQLAAVARAVIGRPALLLADEPTASLDPVRAQQLLRLLLELNRAGTAILLATHDRDLLGSQPIPHLVIHDGRLWEPDPVVQMMARPAP
jgi:cell division transport system ATP-binding protein